MPRYNPKQLPGMVTATDVGLIGLELVTALLVPTVGVPATIATLLLVLARGATLLQYLNVVSQVIATTEDLLQIFVHLKELGLFGDPDDCCEQLKRIADSLRHVKEDETEVSIADITKKLADDWVFTGPNGQEIKVSESLGRLIYYGFYHSSSQP